MLVGEVHVRAGVHWVCAEQLWSSHRGRCLARVAETCEAPGIARQAI